MALIPTFQTLYSDAKTFLEGNTTYQFADFSPGSWLDAITALAAIEALAVMRWTQRRFLAAFISTAEGADLDYVVFDRYGITREPGASDEEFRAAVYALIVNLARATPAALVYYAETIAGVASAVVEEDFETGIVTIVITLDAGADGDTTRAAVSAGLSAWRAAGRRVNVEVA